MDKIIIQVQGKTIGVIQGFVIKEKADCSPKRICFDKTRIAAAFARSTHKAA
jgi:hypothetical protein